MAVKQSRSQICKQKHREKKRAVFTLLAEENILQRKSENFFWELDIEIGPNISLLSCVHKAKIRVFVKDRSAVAETHETNNDANFKANWLRCVYDSEGGNFSGLFCFHVDKARPKTVPISTEAGRDTGTWDAEAIWRCSSLAGKISVYTCTRIVFSATLAVTNCRKKNCSHSFPQKPC